MNLEHILHCQSPEEKVVLETFDWGMFSCYVLSKKYCTVSFLIKSTVLELLLNILNYLNMYTDSIFKTQKNNDICGKMFVKDWWSKMFTWRWSEKILETGNACTTQWVIYLK